MLNVNRIEQNRTEQKCTEYVKREQNRTEQNRAEQSKNALSMLNVKLKNLDTDVKDDRIDLIDSPVTPKPRKGNQKMKRNTKELSLCHRL